MAFVICRFLLAVVIAVLEIKANDHLPSVSSCRHASATGLYKQQLSDMPTPITVLCEMDTYGGGWTVIHQRLTGTTENFNRTWADYRNGFGVVGPANEFWLGLEPLYQLTKNGGVELVVEIKLPSYGDLLFARYEDFGVGDEGTRYKLERIAGYSGMAGDCLAQLKNGKFVTYDRDMVYGIWNFASKYGGGWWLTGTFESHLTGDFAGAHWGRLDSGLMNTRMMVRPKVKGCPLE